MNRFLEIRVLVTLVFKHLPLRDKCLFETTNKKIAFLTEKLWEKEYHKHQVPVGNKKYLIAILRSECAVCYTRLRYNETLNSIPIYFNTIRDYQLQDRWGHDERRWRFRCYTCQQYVCWGCEKSAKLRTCCIRCIRCHHGEKNFDRYSTLCVFHQHVAFVA